MLVGLETIEVMVLSRSTSSISDVILDLQELAVEGVRVYRDTVWRVVCRLGRVLDLFGVTGAELVGGRVSLLRTIHGFS